MVFPMVGGGVLRLWTMRSQLQRDFNVNASVVVMEVARDRSWFSPTISPGRDNSAPPPVNLSFQNTTQVVLTGHG